MPRTRRHSIPDAVYHLISRFVDREWFITTKLERSYYLKLLGAALTHSTWRCLGYAVMSNHIHLAMVASAEPLSNWMRRVHSPFADWMNRSHNRIGNIFVRGPKAVLVPDTRVGQLLAYIHNNPVRAQVVSAPVQSTWTSHRYYAGQQQPPKWLHVQEGLERAQLRRGVEFDKFVKSSGGHPVLNNVDADEHLAEVLEEYERAYLLSLKRAVEYDRVTATAVVHAVAEELELPVELLRSRRRTASEVLGREIVIRAATHFGCTQSEVASALGITRQAISKVARRPPNAADHPIAVSVGRVVRRLRMDAVDSREISEHRVIHTS